jgi:hypothetical protein
MADAAAAAVPAPTPMGIYMCAYTEGGSEGLRGWPWGWMHGMVVIAKDELDARALATMFDERGRWHDANKTTCIRLGTYELDTPPLLADRIVMMDECAG